MIAKVDQRLKDRDMGLELLPAARTLLSERGYDPVLGARPLRRAIQREIEDNLSEKILFGELRAGQIVTVDVEAPGRKRSSRSRAWPGPGPCPMRRPR
jgi:ATP-dependent Clp protease ATP-binding subunit ClpC